MNRSIAAELLASGLLLSPLAANALEIPQVKPGLWELRMQSASDAKELTQSGTTQICWDAATLAASKQKIDAAAKSQDCSKNETRKQGDKWIKEGICKVGGSTVSARTTREFSGENAYHDETISTYDPPLHGRTRVHMIIDGKWMRPC